MLVNICSYLRDVIDENHFHRCVRESQKALLVPVSTKGITVHHELGIEQHSKQDSYLIQRFYLQLLSYNQSLNCEEQGERAAGKDTMKTVMSDNNSQREKFTVLLYNRLFNLHSMTKGHCDAIETNEKLILPLEFKA